MKREVIHLLVVASSLAGMTPVLLAQENVPCRPLVSTAGSAEIRVVPDLADLVFQVEARNADLTKARTE
jgi:uncharacterized protein YggE